jgi:hypothetical protein
MNLMTTMLDKNDLGSYLLHTSAIRQHKRSLLRKKNVADLRERVQTMYPAQDPEKIPCPLMTNLPFSLYQCLQSHSLFKIEWFYMGLEMTNSSSEYKDAFYIPRRKHRRIYSKAMDTVGLSSWNMAFRMFLETLYRPDTVVRYEGVSYFLSEKRKKNVVVKMVSHVYDYEHVVSLTCVEVI